jgi:hypothetical protein
MDDGEPLTHVAFVLATLIEVDAPEAWRSEGAGATPQDKLNVSAVPAGLVVDAGEQVTHAHGDLERG